MDELKTTGWFESVGSIIQRRDEFSNYPPFQRSKVWSPSYRRRGVDSILRGYPIGSIVVAQERSALRGTWYEILDGQQRMHMIFEFASDKFPTQKRSWRDEHGLHPLEPGCLFSEMSETGRRAFLQYKLSFTEIHEPAWNALGNMFRRLQWSNSLKPAEMLWSYQNRDVLVAASTLTEHPYFGQIYTAGNNRKQEYQIVCNLIILAQRTFANVTSGNLHDAAAGAVVATDSDITNLRQTLDNIVHLFDGYQTKSMSEIVPFYQAIKILERDGCDIPGSASGVLGIWWGDIKSAAREAAGEGYNSIIKFDTTVKQARFWQAYYSSLVGVPGLKFRDAKRAFSQYDKLNAWLRQDGNCAHCGKRLYLNDAIGHHINWWANGGPTSGDNCAVYHSHCHREAHGLQQAEINLAAIKA